MTNWGLIRVGAAALSLLLIGCSTMKPEDFANRQPALNLEAYFEGETFASGVFIDRFGQLRRQFNVRIKGVYRDGELTLDEHFCYADGERDRRTWRIRQLDTHRYQGRADDVIGTAVGERYGNALRWRYRLALPIGGKAREVTFDDWMFLQPGGVLINRARMSKFGLTLGEVILFFTRGPAPDDWHKHCIADTNAVQRHGWNQATA